MNFRRLIASLNNNANVRVLAIAGKGGVGKSVIATNLGMACADQGAEVMLFDANLGLGNLDILMGLQVRQTIQDVLAGHCNLDDILLKAGERLQVMPAAIGNEHVASLNPMELTGLIGAFSSLRKTPDVLIVDAPSGISEHSVHMISAAQDILLIVNDCLTSLVDALAYIKVLNEHGLYHFHIVANQVVSEALGQKLFEKLLADSACFDNVSLDLAGVILKDETVEESINIQTPLMKSFPKSRAAQGFRTLANHIFDWALAEYTSDHIGFFVENYARCANTE